MSIILFPFRLIALLFSWLGSTVGLIIAAFVAAFITNHILNTLIWNGVIHWSSGTVTLCCLVSFVLTLMSGGGKK